LRAAARPPLRPAAFFCALVPPCLEEDRDEPECDCFPPRLEEPGELEMRAARSFDIPFSFNFSYCFSFLTLARFPGIGVSFVAGRVRFPLLGAAKRDVARATLSLMEPREDSWESIGWETSPAERDDVDREQVLELARRLADQRQRQRAEDLVQIEDLKRALRERAADVARRELEVERRLQELEGHETPRRSLRFRRAERQPVADSGDEADGEELLSRRETELEERARTLAARERAVAEREAAALARQLELEDAEPALAQREETLRAKQTALEERQREVDDRQQTLDRSQAELSRASDELVQRAATLEEAEQGAAADRTQLAALQRDLDAQAQALAAGEKELAERERALAAREQELTELRDGTAAVGVRSSAGERRLTERDDHLAEAEAQLAAREHELQGREAELLRVQAGLAAQQESVRRRERALEDAERVVERETIAPPAPYVSFSEGLEALTGARRPQG